VPGRRAVFAARFHNEKRESVHINFDGLRLVPSNVQTCAFRHSTSYAFVEETFAWTDGANFKCRQECKRTGRKRPGGEVTTDHPPLDRPYSLHRARQQSMLSKGRTAIHADVPSGNQTLPVVSVAKMSPD